MYDVLVPIIAVQIPKLSPGETVQAKLTPQTYTTSAGSIITTLAGSHMSLHLGQEAADVTRIFIKSPTVNGSAPDFEVWGVVDGTEYNPFQVIDGSLNRNMAPWPDNTAGGPFDADGNLVGGLELGKPIVPLAGRLLERAGELAARGRSAMLPTNIALKTTGWKPIRHVTIQVKSEAGFDTTTASGGTPALVLGYGHIVTQNRASALAAVWNGQVLLNTLARSSAGKAPLDFTQAGNLDLAHWDQLPGGAKQGRNKVQRLIKYATNGVPTVANQKLNLTRNVTPLGGGDTNVASVVLNGIVSGADENHDLGFEANKTSAFWLQEFGVAWAANLGYVGLTASSVQIPSTEDYESGWPIWGQYTNPYQYGAEPGQANVYRPLPRFPGNLLIAGEDTLVVWIRDNGTSIPAGSVYVAIAGPYVEALQAS